MFTPNVIHFVFITFHLIPNMIQFATYLGEYAVSGVLKNGLGCYVC